MVESDVYQTHHGDQFFRDINVEEQRHTPETSIVCYLYFNFFFKGTVRWKRHTGEGMWEEGKASMRSPARHSPQISTWSPTAHLMKPRPSGFLSRRHYIDTNDNTLAPGDSTQAPAPLPSPEVGVRWPWEFQPSDHRWFP